MEGEWQEVTRKKPSKVKRQPASNDDVPFERTITQQSPRLPYNPRSPAKRLVLPWPRRGELITEIEFLNAFPDTEVVVIASRTFEETKNILQQYHKRRFIPYQPRMYIADALFIVEHGIYNMGEQLLMYESNEPPKAALLNFELPYNAGQTRYLDGVRYFIPWNTPSSTMTKLWVTSPNYREYDNTEYEQIMFRFNSRTRLQKFDGLVYDHYTEVTILGKDTRLLDNFLQMTLDQKLKEKEEQLKKISNS